MSTSVNKPNSDHVVPISIPEIKPAGSLLERISQARQQKQQASQEAKEAAKLKKAATKANKQAIKAQKKADKEAAKEEKRRLREEKRRRLEEQRRREEEAREAARLAEIARLQSTPASKYDIVRLEAEIAGLKRDIRSVNSAVSSAAVTAMAYSQMNASYGRCC
jgi:vacuolar-type H+-ATPase subunit I/STV1